VTDCGFEYGTSTFYGRFVPCSAAPGAGEEPVRVHARLQGLSPGVTYHFRIRASNVAGTSRGADGTVLAS
jgi:hypothetical protein